MNTKVIDKFMNEGLELIVDNIQNACKDLYEKEFIKEEGDYIIYLPGWLMKLIIIWLILTNWIIR